MSPNTMNCVRLYAFILCVTLSRGVAQVVTIDSFADPFFLEVNGGVHSLSQVSLGGVLGGERTIQLSSIGSVGRRSMAAADDGMFFQGNDFGALSSVKFEYGKSNPLNVDLSSLGADAGFRLSGWEVDHGTMTARLTLTSGVGTAEEVTRTKEMVLLPVPGLNTFDYVFAFKEFPDVIYRDIDFIGLELINRTSAQDSALGHFAAYAARIGEIPEPSSYALLAGAAALAIARLNRRRSVRWSTLA